jgi:ribonuclease P protein component
MPKLTLPAGSHLRRRKDIRRVFDAGRSSASGPVVVYAAGGGGSAAPRYGLVVGRKWGRAVQRNRIRRRLREAFRHARPDLPHGFDFLLLPRADFGELRTAEIEKHLRRAAAAAVRRCRAATEKAPS